MTTTNDQSNARALTAAISHYERMGWLDLPNDERFKLDLLLEPHHDDLDGHGWVVFAQDGQPRLVFHLEDEYEAEELATAQNSVGGRWTATVVPEPAWATREENDDDGWAVLARDGEPRAVFHFGDEAEAEAFAATQNVVGRGGWTATVVPEPAFVTREDAR